ncbi:MAG: hypothetical protein WA584_23420 [Pyrinomonadaceae bacterium]
MNDFDWTSNDNSLPLEDIRQAIANLQPKTFGKQTFQLSVGELAGLIIEKLKTEYVLEPHKIYNIFNIVKFYLLAPDDKAKKIQLDALGSVLADCQPSKIIVGITSPGAERWREIFNNL